MQVLLFDIDGTLLRSGGAGQSAMETAFQQQFGVTQQIMDIPYAGRTDRAIVQDLFEFYGLQLTPSTWDSFMVAYLAELPRHLSANEGLVLPGVTTLLDQLAGRSDVVLGLLTGNFEQGAWTKLSHYGIDHHFDFGGFGDDHANRDDVARVAYRETQDRHPQVEPDRVWVLGDTPADIRCARAIGARVLAVATGIYSAQELEAHTPDVLCEDLQATQDVLTQLGLLQ